MCIVSSFSLFLLCFEFKAHIGSMVWSHRHVFNRRRVLLFGWLTALCCCVLCLFVSLSSFHSIIPVPIFSSLTISYVLFLFGSVECATVCHWAATLLRYSVCVCVWVCELRASKPIWFFGSAVDGEGNIIYVQQVFDVDDHSRPVRHPDKTRTHFTLSSTTIFLCFVAQMKWNSELLKNFFFRYFFVIFVGEISEIIVTSAHWTFSSQKNK